MTQVAFVLLHLNACVYLASLWRYNTSKIIGSEPWPFGIVTIRLTVGDFLWVVHCDHASILHRYRDIAIWSFSRKALSGRKVGRGSVLSINIWNWLSIAPFRRCDVCTVALMMRGHGDDVYLTSQLCCGLRKCVGKILEKVKFSERYDTSATSHLAHL